MCGCACGILIRMAHRSAESQWIYFVALFFIIITARRMFVKKSAILMRVKRGSTFHLFSVAIILSALDWIDYLHVGRWMQQLYQHTKRFQYLNFWIFFFHHANEKCTSWCEALAYRLHTCAMLAAFQCWFIQFYSFSSPSLRLVVLLGIAFILFYFSKKKQAYKKSDLKENKKDS